MLIPVKPTKTLSDLGFEKLFDGQWYNSNERQTLFYFNDEELLNGWILVDEQRRRLLISNGLMDAIQIERGG